MQKIEEVLETQGFSIIGQVGVGGFSKIFKVKWSAYPDQVFVAKVIEIMDPIRMMIHNPYLNEIVTLKNLYHPNIIQIFKHFIIDDIMVIILEFCPNGNLADLIVEHSEGIGDFYEFLKIARQCLEGLSTCHENNISHRDIKPANILIDQHYRIKICDFGLSEFDKADVKNARFIGSLPFIPPEMIKKKLYDHKKGDIWSLGVTFYSLLCGKLPWKTDTRDHLMESIISIDPCWPEAVPVSIRHMVDNMLNKDPELRHSAAEILRSPVFTQMVCKSSSFSTSSIKTTLDLRPHLYGKKKFNHMNPQKFMAIGKCRQCVSKSQYTVLPMLLK